MNIRMKIKEAFEKSGKSVREIAEAIVLAQSLDLEITELYAIEPFEIEGIGKI